MSVLFRLGDTFEAYAVKGGPVTTILILGAGVMQEPAVRIARRKGWRVILADGNPQAPARDLATSSNAST